MSSDTVLEPQTLPKPIQTQIRRRFDHDDMLNIVKLVAKGCTDTEACKLLGFNTNSWMNWKSRPRNKIKFDEALHEVKGQIIVTCIDGIEKAGNRDWRALRERLALLDRERFSDKAQSMPSTVNVQVFAQIDAVLSKVYAEPKPHAVIDTTATKLLPEPGKP